MNSVPVQVTRTRLQPSQKLCVSGVMKPSRPPVSPTRTYRAGRRCGSRCPRACSARASRARTSESGRYWSTRSGPISPSGITSISVRSMPRPCAHSTSDRDLVLVHALERDRVDLDLQPRRLRGVDAGEHLGEIAPAGDGAEFFGIERVERNVDALHAAGGKLGGVFAAAASRWWSASTLSARRSQDAATASETGA